jgi:hypothetical protein
LLTRFFPFDRTAQSASSVAFAFVGFAIWLLSVTSALITAMYARAIFANAATT